MKAYNKKQVYPLVKAYEAFIFPHCLSYLNWIHSPCEFQASGANAAEEDESEKSVSEVNDDEEGDEGSEEVIFFMEFI